MLLLIGCPGTATIRKNKEFLRLTTAEDFHLKSVINSATLSEVSSIKNAPCHIPQRQKSRLVAELNKTITQQSIGYDYGYCESFLITFCATNEGSVHKFLTDEAPPIEGSTKLLKHFKFAGLMCGLLAEATLNSLINIRAIDAGS